MSENQAVVCRFQTPIQITAAKEDSQNLADSFTAALTRKEGILCIFCHLYIFFTVVSQVALCYTEELVRANHSSVSLLLLTWLQEISEIWVLLHGYHNSHKTAAVLYNTTHLLLNCSCCWKSVLVLILSRVQMAMLILEFSLQSSSLSKWLVYHVLP